MVYFRKVALLEISKSPHLTGVAGLQYTVCNATKSDFLIKFLKGALKPLENFPETISNGVPYQKLQTANCKLQLSALLRVFKTAEKTSTVKFLFSGP